MKMVVDMELEDAKKNVLDLIKEKDDLEMKLLEQKNILESVSLVNLNFESTSFIQMV